MPWYDSLLEKGYVPGGMTPMVSVDGGAPGYAGTDQMSSLARALQKHQADFEAAQKKAQEKMKNQSEMYKTLREAGYDPIKAQRAVLSNELIKPDATDTPLKTASEKERILRKISLGSTLTDGEQQIYDELLNKEASGGSINSVLTAKIREKIAAGETLTPGEQKVYDDTIKHQANPSDLESILGGAGKPAAQAEPATPRSEDMVKVIAPDGVTKGSIPKSKLAAALKAGYKQR